MLKLDSDSIYVFSACYWVISKLRWSSITLSKENSLWQEAAISHFLEHWTFLHFIFLTSNFLKMGHFKIFLCLLYSHQRFVYNRWTLVEPLCNLFMYYIDSVNSRVQVIEKDLEVKWHDNVLEMFQFDNQR